jgi:hypothetical protein
MLEERVEALELQLSALYPREKYYRDLQLIMQRNDGASTLERVQQATREVLGNDKG